jgi:hypothetical protein
LERERKKMQKNMVPCSKCVEDAEFVKKWEMAGRDKLIVEISLYKCPKGHLTRVGHKTTRKKEE